MSIKFKYRCKRRLTVWIIGSWEFNKDIYKCNIEICKLNPKIDYLLINDIMQTNSTIDKNLEKILLSGAMDFANNNKYLDSIRKRMKELNI